MKHHPTRAVTASLFVLSAFAVSGTSALAQEEFRWNGTVQANETMAVHNINGDVEVVVTNGSQIELVATKSGDRDNFDLVRIEIVEGTNGLTFCTIYPSRKRNETQQCAGEEFDRPRHRGDTDVAVDFLLHVPTNTRVAGATVNGDVLVDGTLSHGVATTVNGNVEIASRGSLTATTVNGSVDARLEGSDLDGPVKLTTVNGSIHLDVNDDLNADIKARWVSGGLRTELPLAVRGRVSRSASGQLGAGGYEISLTTVNGSIEIR